MTKKRLVVFCILVFIVIIGVITLRGYFGISPIVSNPNGLPIYTASTLKQYDGTDDKLPVYIAFEGYVYDVSSGRSFYAVGGTYHYIAGTDATKLLRVFGGNIIKQKYPIIGVYLPKK